MRDSDDELMELVDAALAVPRWLEVEPASAEPVFFTDASCWNLSDSPDEPPAEWDSLDMRLVLRRILSRLREVKQRDDRMARFDTEALKKLIAKVPFIYEDEFIRGLVRLFLQAGLSAYTSDTRVAAYWPGDLTAADFSDDDLPVDSI